MSATGFGAPIQAGQSALGVSDVDYPVCLDLPVIVQAGIETAVIATIALDALIFTQVELAMQLEV